MSGDSPCIKKGSKYFISYKNNEGVIRLCVFLPKMNGYLKNFISFLVEEKKFLKTCNEVWG